MSSALAIASVTAVLRSLLADFLAAVDITTVLGGNVMVSAFPPDRIDTAAVNPQNQLNLFFYEATPNQGWRNVNLPSRNSNGDAVSNPPLGLDLHYMLTAYGADQLHTEILLGYGMQLFHEMPFLSRDTVRNSLAGLPAPLQSLSGSDLGEQVEQIKICPQTMSSEEISKLWTAFGAKYRPTATYQASVVLVEGRRPGKAPLPVRARKVRVVPFKQPIIEEIRSQASASDPVIAGQPILAGYNLVLIGTQLRGEDTQVKIGGVSVTQGQLEITDTEIVVTIPQTLRAGVQGVQVVHRIALGDPPVPHRGVESNVTAFVLRPQIVGPVRIANVHGTGSSPRSATLTIQASPAVGDSQRVVLLLNEFLPPASPPQSAEVTASAYSFTVPPRVSTSPPGQDIAVAISGVKAASYLVRVQVDGAESPLAANTTGQYVAPIVSIP